MKWIVALAVFAGCGDNSQECGPGTIDVGGVCTPGGGSALTCGAGTMFDPSSDSCVPANGICGDGTVLIGGTCQNPNAGVVVDLEEGPEPNGFEPGAAPAGIITLDPVAYPTGFVIHGCITPVDDTADFDRYLVTVNGPTLADITSAGIDGLDGGVVVLDGTETYQRYGVDLTSATSEREVYFPAAGTYSVVIADSRTLLGIIESDQAPPAGNPDGSSCYYITVLAETPAAQPLLVPAGATGTLTGGKLQFFAATPGTLPNGFVDLTESIGANEALPSLQIFQNGALRMIRDGFFMGDAEAIFGGILPADTALVVVDNVYDYAVSPATFTLGVASLTTAQALPTGGTAAMAATLATTGLGPADVNLFYFDTTNSDEFDGLVLSLSQPMEGAIVDADFNSVADFGGLSGSAGAYELFGAYQGLIRTHAAARYYLALYGPASPIGTSYTVTSTFQRVVPPQFAFGAPEPAAAVEPYNAIAYTFAPSDAPWGSLNATGVSTGNITIAIYDAAAAYGRLEGLQLSNGTTSSTSPGAPTLLAPFAVPPDGSTPHEYIYASITAAELIVIGSAATPGASATIALDPELAVYTDLGALAAGLTSRSGDTTDPAAPHRYLLTSPKSSALSIDVTGTAALTIATLNPDESIATTASGVDPTLAVTQDVRGYTAFEVTGAAASTYDLGVETTYPFYVAAAGTTTFADACAGSGIDITPSNTDDGISPVFALPPGFTFYGAAVAQAVASTNGFVSFSTALADSHPVPGALGTDVDVAPFWQDLAGVQICEQTVGAKLIVQWSGVTVADSTPVQFQVIMDPATSSIEYVFGPNHAEPGTELDVDGIAAIQGVGSPDGTQVTRTGDGSVEAFAFTTASTLLTH